MSANDVCRDWLTLDELRRCIDDTRTGTVRICVGLATTFAEVYAGVASAHAVVDSTEVQLLDEER